MTSEERSRVMSRIRSSGTRPEVLLRRHLWSMGYRYRINDKRLPGTPDVVLPKYRTVIFVHGCFWHGHDCKHFRLPKTNPDFWKSKIETNRDRDEKVWRSLEAMGWSVIVVWECELGKDRVDGTLSRVISEIARNGETKERLARERRDARRTDLAERKAAAAKRAALVDEIRNKYST